MCRKQFVEVGLDEQFLQNLSPEQVRDLISYLMHPQQVALPESTD